MQHGAQHFTIERCTNIRVHRVDVSHDAADVQELNHIAGVQLFGQAT